jgi:Subunit ChlI of Mg-chelatase
MPTKAYSAAVVGVEAFEVEIEVHVGWGNTDKIAMVGLPATAVKESKDRVTSAISQQRLSLAVWKTDHDQPGPGRCQEGRTQLRSADCSWNAETGRKQSIAGP